MVLSPKVFFFFKYSDLLAMKFFVTRTFSDAVYATKPISSPKKIFCHQKSQAVKYRTFGDKTFHHQKYILLQWRPLCTCCSLACGFLVYGSYFDNVMKTKPDLLLNSSMLQGLCARVAHQLLGFEYMEVVLIKKRLLLRQRKCLERERERENALKERERERERCGDSQTRSFAIYLLKKKKKNLNLKHLHPLGK